MAEPITGRDAYPLTWPDGIPRTPRGRRERSRFKATFARARDGVLDELRLLGVGDWSVIISTDIPLRRDGLPYANRPEPNDPGAAVYFRLHGAQRVLACDRWDRVRDNLRAIELTVGALRGLDRWGSSDLVERAFRGFAALPPTAEDWRIVLGFDSNFARSAFDSYSLELVEKRYRELAEDAHPDHGGDPDEMVKLNAARAAARRELVRR